MTTLPVHPGADAVLDALDPEQREVAAHQRADVRTRRRGHRQDPRHHPPHRLRRALGRLPAPAGPGRHLHGARPARCAPACATSASAACRPAPSTPPRCASCTTSGRRRSAARPRSCRTRRAPSPRPAAACGCGSTDRPCATSPPRSSGPRSAAHPGDVCRGRHARAAGPPAGLDATAMARLVAGLRGGQDRARGHRLRGRAAAHGRHPARARRGRAGRAQPVPPLRRRRVPGRQPAPADPARPVAGGRRDLCVVGDPARPSTRSPGPRPSTCSASAPGTPRRARSSSCATTGRPHRWWGWPTSCCGAPGAAPLGVRRAAGPTPRRPRARARRGRQRPRRGGGRRHPHRRRSSPAGAPPSEIAVLFRTNGQSEAFETALAGARHPVPRARWRAVLLAQGGPRRHRPHARGRTVRRRRGAAARARPRRAPRRGLDPRGPDERRCRPRALGVAGGPGRARRRPPCPRPGRGCPALVRELEERAAGQHAPTVKGVTLASLHAAKGLEWDTVFLVGCSDGLLPITMADTPRRSRRSGGCSTWASRGPVSASSCPTRGARTPGPRPPVVPLASSTARESVLGEAAAPSPSVAAGARRPRSPAPVRSTCRTCGATSAPPRERTIGRCSDCPPTMDEQLFEALREWRLATAREADVPAYVVFTDATLTAIAEQVPTDAGGLARHQRRRAGQARALRRPPSWTVLQNFSDEQSA